MKKLIKNTTINTFVQKGWKIYDPMTDETARCNYRYGPVFIINEDRSIDMWVSSGGLYGEWDWIAYTRSLDGGLTWVEERIAIRPSPGMMDGYSVCDPAILKIGQYYYLGYTSLDMNLSYGWSNNIFVARSTFPEGPYEKWNGNGWGGNPKPFIIFDGPANYYGAGEPSFVEKDGTVYIYYSWISEDQDGKKITQTRLCTAPSTSDNWPGNLTYQGIAINKKSSSDSADVKYISDYGKFLAITTADRFTADSYVKMYESTDGINFTPSNISLKNLEPFLHNAGISGRANGHINLFDNNFIAYAYGYPWASWRTHLNPISLSNDNKPFTPRIFNAEPLNKAVKLYFELVSGKAYKVKYGTTSGNYTEIVSNINTNPYTITKLTNDVKYYFVITTYDANGESINSNEISAKPKPYEKLSLSNVMASSQTDDNKAPKAVDNDVSTYWSSESQSSFESIQWIKVDTGTNNNIGKVILIPEQRSEFSFPVDLTIQVSQDDIKWTNSVVSDDQDFICHFSSNISRYIYLFKNIIYGRYIRIKGNVLKENQKTKEICMKIAEIEVYRVNNDTLVSNNIFMTHYRINNGDRSINISDLTPVQLSIKKFMSDGTEIDITGSLDVKYLNYDPYIITVSSDGCITARKSGTTIIKTIYEDKPQYIQVHIFNLLKSNYGADIGDFNTSNIDKEIYIEGFISPGTVLQNVLKIPLTVNKPRPFNVHSFIPRGVLTDITKSPLTTLSGYDTNLIKINSNREIVPIAEGITTITVNYRDLQTTIPVEIDSNMIDNWWNYAVFEEINGLEGYKIADKNKTTTWSSSYGNETTPGWVYISADQARLVKGLVVTPSALGIHFPVDFKFQHSDDGTIWTNIPDQSYTDYPKPSSNEPIRYTFTNSVQAKYFRMYISKRRKYDGYYFIQLAEFDLMLDRTPEILEFNAFHDTFNMTLDGDLKQLLSIVLYDDGVREYLAYEIDGLTYTGYNSGIISVDEYGIIKPMSTGTTTITVNYQNKFHNVSVRAT
jgi:hypothetical protein